MTARLQLVFADSIFGFVLPFTVIAKYEQKIYSIVHNLRHIKWYYNTLSEKQCCRAWSPSSSSVLFIFSTYVNNCYMCNIAYIAICAHSNCSPASVSEVLFCSSRVYQHLYQKIPTDLPTPQGLKSSVVHGSRTSTGMSARAED